MKKLDRSWSWTYAAISLLFAIMPESLFDSFPLDLAGTLAKCEIIGDKAVSFTIAINRVCVLLIIWGIMSKGYCILLKCRKSITIKGKNYIIQVEYGNLLGVTKCKRVIHFDECFTTCVGTRPEDINENSLCGRYLKVNQNLDINRLIKDAGVEPTKSKSRFQHKTKYKSGTIVANGNDLLMAFAPLDEDGRGRFTSLKEYEECLSTMWDELDKHYGQNDVCIPILGSGVTRFGTDGSASPTQQELLDMMIWSYKLNPHKIKPPHKLRIICQKRDGFSLNDIDCY